jgi:elongation factor P
MPKLGANDLRKRVKLLIDNQPHVIIDADFVKPGKGQAFTKIKVKNYITGKQYDRTYKSTETAESCDVATSTMNYLYNDSANWSFMDMESYEQIEVPKESMDGTEKWLLDNTPCEVTVWEGKVLEVVPPPHMNLKIIEAPPGIRGDTSGSVTRPATLETGVEIQIPLFINEGETIKVDTRTGEYLERAKK